MKESQKIILPILKQYPKTQAIYMFGSYGTENQWPNSDLDVAILFPVMAAKRVDFWEWLEVSNAIAAAIQIKNVDFINLRQVDTVFRKEIIRANRLIYCTDTDAADEFEMIALSLYQKLVEERRDIVHDALTTGRFYNV